MRGLKTFNLSQECIKLVRSKSNQSRYVERAIFKMHKLEKDREKEINQIDLSDIPTKRFLVILSLREDTPDAIRALIQHHLYNS